MRLSGRSTSRSSAAAWSAPAALWLWQPPGARGADRRRCRPIPTRSRASMSARRRWATPAGASSKLWACGARWRRRRPRSAAIHVSDAGRLRLRAAGGAASRASMPSATSWPTGCIGAALWEQLARQRAHQRARAARQCAAVADRRRRVDTHDRRAATRARERARAASSSPPTGRTRACARAAGIGAVVEDYGQIALVANVAADRPHDGTAYERFTPAGPLAVLPLHDGSYSSSGRVAAARRRAALAAPMRTFLQRCSALRLARGQLRARRPPRLLSFEADARGDATVGARARC